MDLSGDEEYIEGNLQTEKQKRDETPSAPRFLSVEMEDVYQFLSSHSSSPAFNNIFESKNVDETLPSFTPQLETNRKPSILQRLGRTGSVIPTPAGSVDANLTDSYALSSVDAEYDSAFGDDKKPKSGNFIITEQTTEFSDVNLVEEKYEQDEIEVAEYQVSNEDNNLLSPIAPNPELDLYNWVFGPPHLTRAESGCQEKIQKRKSKYKKPRLPDRIKVEKDKRKKEHHAIISENRDIKTILDDNDHKKEALRARELNSKEKTHDKSQDDNVIFRKEPCQSSRVADLRNKESPDRTKKDSKCNLGFPKTAKLAGKDICSTPFV